MTKVIALFGKAGSGKDTVLKLVLENNNYHKVVPYTTRPMREKEADGVDYHFISLEKFSDMYQNNELFGVATFNGWMYGWGYDSFDPEEVNIGVFNIAALNELIFMEDTDFDIYLVRASDKARLMRQLTREDYPNVEEIIRRYHADEEDFNKSMITFNYTTILNEITPDLEDCVKLLGKTV